MWITSFRISGFIAHFKSHNNHKSRKAQSKICIFKNTYICRFSKYYFSFKLLIYGGKVVFLLYIQINDYE